MDKNLAVLIDFENIAAGTEKEGLGRFDVDALMNRLTDKGRILVSRSYADWGRFARFKQGLLAANVVMFELPSHGMQSKNRADIAMVVDCLELALTHQYIDTFVIVSGDSDFTPLVLKVRELNKHVIGVGTRSSTSKLLVGACDEFIYYDTLARPRRGSGKRQRSGSRSSSSKTLPIKKGFDLLVDALDGMQDGGEPSLASVVKSAMRRKAPDFSEADYGFKTFGRFLDAASRKGLIRTFRDQKSGGYRVELADEDGDNGAIGSKSSAGSTWVDPYAPEDATAIIEALANEGYNPASAPTRKAIIEHIEGAVEWRANKRRRCNVKFVTDDVRKRLGKSHPDVPFSVVKQVIDALMRSQVFMHKDGNPVRSKLAPFHLDKDAAGINEAITNLYLEVLLTEIDGDTSDPAMLAELFYGDRERKRAIEEALAWLAANRTDEGDDEDEDEDEDEPDLDDLLVAADADDADDDDTEASESDDDKKAKASKSDDDKKAKSKKSDDDKKAKASKSDDDKASTKKSKSSAKKKEEIAEKLKDEATEAAAEDGEDEDAKPRRRKVRKKAAKKEEAEDGSLDALLEATE